MAKDKVNHITQWQSKAKRMYKEYSRFLKNLKHKNSRLIDQIAQQNTDIAYSLLDCRSCANCCKTLSPIVKHSDIKRISKHLGMREMVFISTYLTTDSNNDYIMKSVPCPFLLDNNMCSIYDIRPIDCSDYPHTHQVNFKNLIDYHNKNILSCPISHYVVDGMMKAIK